MGGSSDNPNSNNNNINSKAIDASVGALVWVRRRNGSWWPGRIVGLEEISEGSLVSPRSGTPVKLLGREDASVDWYNLEKSKRVKAFRCGEYDECIEKAKASAANGNKRVVKYARREDAILHALEIENARLGKDQLDFFSRSDNLGEEHGSSAKESSMSFSGKEDDDTTDGDSDSEDNSNAIADSDSSLDSDSGSLSDLAPELSQSDTYSEEPNLLGACKVQSLPGKRRRTPNDSEDDGTEGIKRMRGLGDLGIGVGDSNTGNCMPNFSSANGSKGYNSLLKRKRSQVANVNELLKRKNRHRTLTKVLESTTMVCVPVICDQLPSSSSSPLPGLSDSKISGIVSNESRKDCSIAINNNTDNTGVSCENAGSLKPSEHAYDAPLTNHNLKKEKDISSISGLTENDSADRLFDVPFVGEEKHSTGISPVLVSCSSGSRQIGGLGRQCSQSSLVEAVLLKNEACNESGSSSLAVNCVYNNISQRIEKGTSKWQSKGKRNSRHTSKNKNQDSRKDVDMDDEPSVFSASMEHMDELCQGPGQEVDCSRGKPQLFTEEHVNVVQDWSKSFCQGGLSMKGVMVEMAVPQRSLPYRQSRFTVNSRYPTSDFSCRNFSSGSKLFNVDIKVQRNYRQQHVPLVSLMSKFNGKAIVGHPLTIENFHEDYSDILLGNNEGDTTHVTEMETLKLDYAAMRNLEPARHMTMKPLSSPSKSHKLRKCGLLSKKIRKLSSLTGKKVEDRKLVVEKSKGPVITCIPLKLVFSRINEAVNGSARQTHRALTSSNS
ncbi:TUDOR/PWWP/MBT SUPERFAMILY PROTEIN [Salix koriyanagi]|uniref:TUDOR/PWWP/MBT SUPERFAMILY PROTEIN n=1 Tax=Salix koriyanagi TaxID=2511006 RepID=A0A9Q0Q744_9ROSI|nr:TUDOR/PWWP/MBT SUPERFAMILY PROTEIN [Salix koriyanagi]